VPEEEGNKKSGKGYAEKRKTGYERYLPGLWHQDVPYRLMFKQRPGLI
jgi:hypothetical protein